MRPFTPFSFTTLALSFVLLALAQTAHAQSSVLFIPSTDVAADKSKYVEGDVAYNPRSYDNGGYFFVEGRSIFGLGKGLEVGGNIAATKTNQPNPVEFQPNLKMRWYSNDEQGIAIASGVIGYLPVANTSYGDNFAMVYTVASKKFGDNGPRVTAGGYGLIGRDRGTGNRSGFLLGIEQPLTSKVTFAIDHNSGNQVHGGYGSTTAGFITTVNKNVVVGTAWSFVNTNMSGSNGFFGWVGFTF